MINPPFCPHAGCAFHVRPDSHEARLLRVRSWFLRCGYYATRVRGRVQRFRCTSCGRGFSEQTFRLDYYVKRRISYRRIQMEVKSCSGVRQMARNLSVSPATVTNRISRLSRQVLAAHAQLLTQIHVAEDLVADGFESFSVSQYYPNNIHLLVGKDSQFTYCADYVPIRRKGTMTERQHLKRTALEMVFRPDPRGISRSFALISEQVDRLCQTSILPVLTLWSDSRSEYGRELRNNASLERRRKCGNLSIAP